MSTRQRGSARARRRFQLTVGAGALVASGSVITEDVPADALAFGRARQTNKPQAAADFREKAKAKKEAAKAAKLK